MNGPYAGSCWGLWFIDVKVNFTLSRWSSLCLSGLYKRTCLWVVVASIILLFDNWGQEKGQAIGGTHRASRSANKLFSCLSQVVLLALKPWSHQQHLLNQKCCFSKTDAGHTRKMSDTKIALKEFAHCISTLDPECIYIYIHMHTYIYTYTYTHIYAYIYIFNNLFKKNLFIYFGCAWS